MANKENLEYNTTIDGEDFVVDVDDTRKEILLDTGVDSALNAYTLCAVVEDGSFSLYNYHVIDSDGNCNDDAVIEHVNADLLMLALNANDYESMLINFKKRFGKVTGLAYDVVDKVRKFLIENNISHSFNFLS